MPPTFEELARIARETPVWAVCNGPACGPTKSSITEPWGCDGALSLWQMAAIDRAGGAP